MTDTAIAEQPTGIEGRLIDAIAKFFMDNAAWNIYKTFSEGKELDKDFWDDNLSNSILLHNREGVDKDILIVQIREATEEGYLTLSNVEEKDEGNWELLKSMDVLAFDITEDGIAYIKPFIKDKLVEHFQGIIDKVKEIES